VHRARSAGVRQLLGAKSKSKRRARVARGQRDAGFLGYLTTTVTVAEAVPPLPSEMV
jgi:hypothetical protein